MKKILFSILFASFGIISANAQEIDSLQIKSDTISIETLAEKLDKLQHDYDYLYCEHQLISLQYKIEIFMNEVGVSSNSIKIYYYNNRYNKKLYNSYKDNYYGKVELFNSFRRTVELTKETVNTKVLSSNFSDTEISVLQNLTTLLDYCLIAAESTLNDFKVGIDAYRDLY